MAPPNTQKRVKGVQIFRPFVYGTTAIAYGPSNPKPSGVPEEHTHSWTVFVRGVGEDSDITYWCKKVQFKLHESIPQPLRMVEDVPPGKPFETRASGWGEFEIVIKIFYDPVSNEKAQTFYHQLKLHAFGITDAEKDAMTASGEITSWQYEEQVFNEPYEQFYEVLTSVGGKGQGQNGTGGRGKGKGTKVMGGGMVGRDGGADRGALIPLQNSPRQPFSRETERLEIKRLVEAQKRVEEMTRELAKELKEKEETLRRLRQDPL